MTDAAPVDATKGRLATAVFKKLRRSESEVAMQLERVKRVDSGRIRIGCLHKGATVGYLLFLVMTPAERLNQRLTMPDR